jgi:hypothetical protein
MVGLLSAGLVVAMLPGVAVAKDDGKSACEKDGWTEWVREDQTAFADQAECVAYVAEGGTLLPPGPTFQSVCQDYGGEYRVSYTGLSYTVAPACLWWGASWDTWASATGPLTAPPLCPDWSGGAEWAPSVDPDYAGC